MRQNSCWVTAFPFLSLQHCTIVQTPAGWYCIYPAHVWHKWQQIQKNHVRTKKKINLRGLCFRTDSVLLRSLHLLAGDPLHSASSPRCRWCMFSKVPLPLGTVLEPNALLLLLLLQQLPLVATMTWLWKTFWLCPLLTWKGPEAPFLSTIDLALSMAAATLAERSLASVRETKRKSPSR